MSLSLGVVGSVSLAPSSAIADPTPTTSPAPNGGQSADAVASADTLPPVLTGVSVAPANAVPGDALTISYTYTDDSPLAVASFEFWNRTLDGVVYTDSVAPVAGSHEVTLKTDAINGDYVLTRVRLKDAAGNESDFRSDGTVRGTPNPPTSPTHGIQFSKVLFTVSGSSIDAEPPVLTSLSLVNAGTYVGDSSTFAYGVTDQTAPLDSVVLGFSTDGSSHGVTGSDVPVTGSLSTVFPQAGRYALDSVTIYDGRGLWSVYRRDGSTSDVFGQTSRHSIDFTKLDVTHRPAAPTVTTRSMPKGIGLAIWHTGEQLAEVSGYRFSVSPGGYSVVLPASPGERQTHEVPGLTNGTTYTVSVTPMTQWGDGKRFTATVTPMPSRNIFGTQDVNGDRTADVFAHLRDVATNDDPAYLYPGNGAGGFGRKSLYASQLGSVAPAGDTNADGRGDLLAIDDNGYLETIHQTSSARLGSGWGSMRFVDGGADFSGDGHTDILAVTRTGDLYLYRVSYDRIRSSSKIGSGWGSMHAFFTPGDFSGDGKADIVAMDATGDLWLYRGSGTGGFLSRLKIGVRWAGFGAVLPMRDFNGDGRADIGAVTMSGDLLLYPGNGRSGFLSSKKIGTGWHAFF